MCPDLAESNNRVAHVSVGQYLKFRYDAPSFAMLSTLNNPQDLGPEYLKASFPIKWTLANESHSKPQCVMIGVPVLRPVETEMIIPKTSNVRRWSLFDYVITVI